MYMLIDLGQVTCGTLGLSTATVKLIGADGKEQVACSVGTGPVDSAYKAVDLIFKVDFYMLLSYLLIVSELPEFMYTPWLCCLFIDVGNLICL